jgi:hypothetical protein
MHIRYRNIILAALVVVITVMATRPNSPIRIFLRSLTHLGPEHPNGERILGAVAWILVVILFVVTLRRFTGQHHR